MGLFDYLRPPAPGPEEPQLPQQRSAVVAKERLRILVAHDRIARDRPSYLPHLEHEILEVIRRYVDVEPEAVSVRYDQEESKEILELNIVLPESPKRPSRNGTR